MLINPLDTPDEYLGQFESTITTILDEVAPIRHGTRPGGRKAGKWLKRKQCRPSSIAGNWSVGGRNLAVNKTESPTEHRVDVPTY